MDLFGPHSSTPEELKQLHAVRRTGHAFIAWRDDKRKMCLEPLIKGQEPLTIGRGKNAAISLPWDARVSRVHAELEALSDVWLLVDDGLSVNGTFVNGERIPARRRLREGDQIGVGDQILVYCAASDADGDDSGETQFGGGVRRGDLKANDLAVLIALCEPLILDTSDEPASTKRIASQVHLGDSAIKHCLTRMFKLFDIRDEPKDHKRERLAEKVIELGIVNRHDYT
jgi:hypothetical protein